MPVKVEIKGFDLIDDIVDASQRGMLQYAINVRENIIRMAPFGIGTLRESFKVTGPFAKLDKLEASVESNVEYAEKQDQDTLRHMPFKGNDKGGQRSFGEFSRTTGTKMKKYRGGYVIARSEGNFDVYKSDYLNKAVEEAGGDEGMVKLIDKAIQAKLRST